MTSRTIDPWPYIRASTAGPQKLRARDPSYLTEDHPHTNQDQEQGFDTVTVPVAIRSIKY